MPEQCHAGVRRRGRRMPRMPGLGKQRVPDPSVGRAGHRSRSSSRRGHLLPLTVSDLARGRSSRPMARSMAA
eukprot:9156150-Pyramimonas_sp.AAC.1